VRSTRDFDNDISDEIVALKKHCQSRYRNMVQAVHGELNRDITIHYFGIEFGGMSVGSYLVNRQLDGVMRSTSVWKQDNSALRLAYRISQLILDLGKFVESYHSLDKLRPRDLKPQKGMSFCVSSG